MCDATLWYVHWHVGIHMMLRWGCATSRMGLGQAYQKKILLQSKKYSPAIKKILLQSKKYSGQTHCSPYHFLWFSSVFYGFASIFHGVHQFSHVFSLVFNPVHRFFHGCASISVAFLDFATIFFNFLWHSSIFHCLVQFPCFQWFIDGAVAWMWYSMCVYCRTCHLWTCRK